MKSCSGTSLMGGETQFKCSTEEQVSQHKRSPNLAAAIDLHVLGVGEIMHGSSVGGSDMAAVGENNAGEVVVKGMTH